MPRPVPDQVVARASSDVGRETALLSTGTGASPAQTSRKAAMVAVDVSRPGGDASVCVTAVVA